MKTNPVEQNKSKIISRSRLVPGIVLVVFGLAILLLFGRNLQAGQQTTFGLTPIGDKNVIPIPDLKLPVQTSIYVLALITFFVAGWQLARGIRKNSLVVGVVAFCFVA